MKKSLLAWIGTPFFAKKMSCLGWEVCDMSFRHIRVYHWSDIVKRCGREPDAVVLGDKSHPPTLPDVLHYPCPTLFYCVDSHIHSWYPVYAQLFDACTVSLHDHLDQFRNMRLAHDHLAWFPPFAPDSSQDAAQAAPPESKQVEVLFAGRVNQETTPQRYEFLRALKQRVPGLVVTQGDFSKLFPRAKIVLNYAERLDLNYRVFEAMGCGSCLVTPRVAHGQDLLFTHGEHCFMYDQNNMDELVALLHSLLNNPQLCEQIAQQGLAAINSSHRAHHRAEQLNRMLRASTMDEHVQHRLRDATTIHEGFGKMLYLLHAQSCEDPGLRQAYLQAAMAPGVR